MSTKSRMAPSLFENRLPSGSMASAVTFLVTAAFLIAIWALLSYSGMLPGYLVPSPAALFDKLVSSAAFVLPHAGLTAMEIICGFFLAVVGAVFMAACIVFVKSIDRAVYPWLVVLQVIPKVALGPLLIIWLGFGFFPKVLMAFLMAFFPIMIATIAGLRSVELNSIHLIRSMGAGRFAMFRFLQLPTALPHLFGSLKVAMTFAVVGALVGEFVGANEGLGYLLIFANGSMDTTLLFVSLTWIAALALALYGVVALVERRCVWWHISHRMQGVLSGANGGTTAATQSVPRPGTQRRTAGV